MRKIASAAVIGTGMMGPGIAATLAMAGIPVRLISRSEESARGGVRKALSQIVLLRANGLGPAATDAHIEPAWHLDHAVSGVDLVIESAPEDMAFKQALFARMEGFARPDCILATNTSGLSITEIAKHCTAPERVITAHFWNPPHLMPLVEVVKGAHTSDETANDMMDLLKACGKMPVLVRKDRPGQLGNRLQMALVREAANIVEEGIASVEDVDLATKNGFGLRLPVYGIFEHQDAVGLDMGLGILDYIAADLYNEPKAPDSYRRRVEEGKVGAKAGVGFYDWNFKDIEAVKRGRDEFVLRVLRQRAGLD